MSRTIEEIDADIQSCYDTLAAIRQAKKDFFTRGAVASEKLDDTQVKIETVYSTMADIKNAELSTKQDLNSLLSEKEGSYTYMRRAR